MLLCHNTPGTLEMIFFFTQLVLEKIYKSRKLYLFVIARSPSKYSQAF